MTPLFFHLFPPPAARDSSYHTHTHYFVFFFFVLNQIKCKQLICDLYVKFKHKQTLNKTKTKALKVSN